MSAGLFVLPGGMLAASWAIEPGMYLRNSPFQEIVLGAGMIVLFWVLSPILVLRSRTVSIARPFLALFATVAVAAPVYAWIAQWTRHNVQTLAVV
jgi:hypothetical protein